MARPLPTRSEILRSLGAEPRAMHASELAARLEVSPGSRRAFGELLEQLAFDGAIRAQPGRRYRALSEEDRPKGWEGTLSVNPRGFGFVSAVGHDDVYIAPDGVAGALHGDTVRIEIVARSARGLEGRVVDIVSRRNPRVSGRLVKRRKSAWLEPDDARVRGPIVLTELAEEGHDGDAAVALITRFPVSPRENPEGRLIGVLGQPGDPRAEVEKVLLREGIQTEHSPEALREAEERLRALTPAKAERGRKDLTDLPLLTIDPVDARDHDDAVFAERRGDGYRAVIAIADVSEFVQPGGALDDEAAQRSFTTYLPDRAVPMLPRELSADQCSLLPGKERYALCVIVDLDSHVKVKRVRVVEAVVVARALISYEDAARALGYLEGEPRGRDALRFRPQLKVLDEIAKKLRRARLARGALDLDLPEPKVELDPETGEPTAITIRARDPGVKATYQLVEEFMLLANERVARFLSSKNSPAVYRVHAPPDEERLEQLEVAARRLNAPFDVLPEDGPLGLSRWLADIADHPAASVLEMLLLRSLKQAQYDIVNVGHFGLALDSYVHFTSPIRRYPDLLVHRLVKGLVRGEPARNKPSEVEDLRNKATQASRAERVVMQVEREVVDLYRCLYMRRHVGDEFEARVTGISGTGLYASIESPFADVLVRFESLGSDHFEAREDALGVVGAKSGESIFLGERLWVVIEDVAIERRTVYARRIVRVLPEEPLEAGESRRPRRARAGAPRPEARGRAERRQERRARPERATREAKSPRTTRGERRKKAGLERAARKGTVKRTKSTSSSRSTTTSSSKSSATKRRSTKRRR